MNWMHFKIPKRKHDCSGLTWTTAMTTAWKDLCRSETITAHKSINGQEELGWKRKDAISFSQHVRILLSWVHEQILWRGMIKVGSDAFDCIHHHSLCVFVARSCAFYNWFRPNLNNTSCAIKWQIVWGNPQYDMECAWVLSWNLCWMFFKAFAIVFY